MALSYLLSDESSLCQAEINDPAQRSKTIKRESNQTEPSKMSEKLYQDRWPFFHVCQFSPQSEGHLGTTGSTVTWLSVTVVKHRAPLRCAQKEAVFEQGCQRLMYTHIPLPTEVGLGLAHLSSTPASCLAPVQPRMR